MALTILPDTRAIKKICGLTEKSVEGAEYFLDHFKEKLTAAKMLDECKDMLAKVTEFVEYVRCLSPTSQPWSGEIGKPSTFMTMQDNLAKEIAKELKEEVSGMLESGFAINDAAQFLRGYSAQGQALDTKQADMMDKLFNAWLAEHDIVNKNSTLFQAEAGQVKMDNAGNPLKANAEKVRQLLNNDEKGFKKFLDAKEISITVHQFEYPAKGPDKRTNAEQLAQPKTDVNADMTSEAQVNNEVIEPQSSIQVKGS